MTTVTIGHRAGDTAGIDDCSPSQGAPTSTNGTSDRVYVSSVSAGNAKRSIFVMTGISSIPTNAIVSAASLTLYRLNAASPARNYNIHKLLKLPSEANATWNNQTTGTPWTSGGAGGDGTDADLTNIIATGAIPTGAGSTITVSSAGFLALVQGWIAGTIANCGILMKIDAEGTYSAGDFDIASGERSTEAQRPYLTVTYDIPTPPDITVSDVAVNNLSGTATFTVTFSSSYPSDITINCTTANNTAIAGTDYTETSVTPLTIPAGQTTGTVTVPIIP